jgi:hypothetical protein
MIVALALAAQAPKEAPASPAVTPPPAATSCPEGCQCPFPGACGHKDCDCKPAVGWTPPGEWRVFLANPRYEVFGREDDQGVFRYTKSRLRRTYQGRYLCERITRDGWSFTAVVIDLLEVGGGGSGDPPASAPRLQLRTHDAKVKAMFAEGKTVVLTIAPVD